MSENQKLSLRDTIAPKSDQLNYDDVASRSVTVRVTGLSAGSSEQPVIVKIARQDNGLPMRDYKPCKSMRRVLIAAWGDKGRDWIGKSMTLYGDSGVVFGGVSVGGIRISHVSGIDSDLRVKLTTTRSKRTDYIVKPLSDALDRAPKQRDTIDELPPANIGVRVAGHGVTSRPGSQSESMEE